MPLPPSTQPPGRPYRAAHPDHYFGWLKSLEQIKALAPKVVIAGHKEPALSDDPVVLDDTAAYIRKFDELVPQHTTAEALFAAMKEAFPDLTGDIVLQFSTQAAYPSAN